MTSLALSFQETTFTVTDRDGQHWLRASEIAQALGYANNDAVGKLYDRNADEFTGSMTQVVEVPVTPSSTVTKNLQNKVRIFSLRGCHLLAMFARTAVAKEFRKWVLDVLDREVASLAINKRQSITPEQQAELHAIVEDRAKSSRGIRTEMWSRHNKHFRIAKYSQLLAVHFDDAKRYLETMEIKSKSPEGAPSLLNMLASEASLLITSQIVPLLTKQPDAYNMRFFLSLDMLERKVYARPLTNAELIIDTVRLMEGHESFKDVLRGMGIVECAAFAKITSK